MHAKEKVDIFVNLSCGTPSPYIWYTSNYTNNLTTLQKPISVLRK